jgi:hypothetical protein
MSVETDTPATNAEAIQAWDGPLFERFSRYRELVTTGLGNHGDAALALFRRRPASGCLTSAAASATPRSESPGW